MLNIEFNLVLGNEPWLLGDDLPEIINSTAIISGVYTTCQPTLWGRYHESFFIEKGLDNLSIGVDSIRQTPVDPLVDDSLLKTFNAWHAFDWVKEHAPWVDCHATVTLHQENYRILPDIIRQLDAMNVYSNINFIHWNKDGAYDFFGEFETLKHLLFQEDQYSEVQAVLEEVKESQKLLQNPEMLEQPVDKLVNMGWHCNGDPYGGPTIDADGSLRVCGYRKGTRTPKFSIFDLPDKETEWKQAVYDDAQECPGCQWSCSWMFNYWNKNQPDKGTDIFTKHKII
jgi:hypothetical protein